MKMNLGRSWAEASQHMRRRRSTDQDTRDQRPVFHIDREKALNGVWE